MSNASFTFASNVKLTVPNGTTLTVQGAHLYACDQMWKGIEVQEGGKVIITPYIVSGTIQKTTLIEDALTAINFLPITQQQLSQVFAVDNTTFNKNQTAISIQGYPFINASTIFNIKNSLITCRSIFNTATPLTWPLTSTVKTLNNNTNLYANPYITTAYVISSLKAPNSGRAVFGIKLNNVGLTTGTTSNPVYNELIIGSTNPVEYNLFDHVETGIDVLNSNFTVQNCKFQDPKKIVITGTPSGFATGINAQCTNQTKYRSQVNSECAFYNQFRAIKVDYYADCNVTGNTFRSIRTIAYSASTPTTTIPGRYGVYLKCSDYNAVTIINNFMYNIEKGVYVGTEIVPQFNSPVINVNNNTIASNIPAQPISTNSVFDAITVLNVNSVPYGGTLYIQNNYLNGVYRGILVQNWSKTLISVFLNNLTLVDQANDPEQYGIAFKGNIGGTQKNQIAQNLVNGFTGSTTYTLTSGVLVESSNMNNVECNNTYNTYNGLHFKGTTNYTSTKRNTMQNNKYGFVLDGAAVQLGFQGALNAPCDNIWSGAWSPTLTPNGNFKTLVTNAANAFYSKMYIRSTNLGLASSFNPNNSFINISPSLSNYVYSSAQNNLWISSGPATSCNSALIIDDTTLVLEAASAQLSANLAQIDNVLTSDYAAKIQTDVYRSLDAEPSKMVENLELQAFYDSVAIGSKGSLLEVEKLLVEGDKAAAENQMTSILTSDLVEYNYKLFYELSLAYMNGAFSPQDSIELVTLATSCPETNGNVVYQARGLFNAIYSTAEIFEASCAPSEVKSMMIQSASNQQNAVEIELYPNPNKGEFTVKLPTDLGIVTIQIKDMTGKVLSSTTYQTNEQLIHVKSNLNSGMYYIEISNDLNQLIYLDKFMILN